MEVEPYPYSLGEGCRSADELLARQARFRVLMELGFFGVKTTLDLAKGNYKGRFNGAVRKRFAGIYQNTEGCSAGDIEVAAELVGYQDGEDYISAIYDYENRVKT